MKTEEWFTLLKERKNLQIDYCNKVFNEIPIFLIDAINNETSKENSFIVYDHSAIDITIFHMEELNEIIEKNMDATLVIVFNNWDHEREIFQNHYKQLKNANSRREFSNLFDTKLSIYLESKDKVILETDQCGINYLEYSSTNKFSSSLKGRIYNISFFNLKKLFNVTGLYLFRHNVRYGLKKHNTGEILKIKFREYLNSALYQKALDNSWPTELLEAIKESLEINPDIISLLEHKNEDELLFDIFNNDSLCSLPENFWFNHNGISIFSYDDILETPTNQIILQPNHVNVINGAQTVTNFFLQVENITLTLKNLLSKYPEISLQKTIDSILKNIYVKTIIIYGDYRFIRSITHGLNTQIPVLPETLLTDSTKTLQINKLLSLQSNKVLIKILKEGEIPSTEYSMYILDFVKYWLVINDQPGKSKNFPKKELESTLDLIIENLKKNKTFINDLILLFQIYEWWDNSKIERIDMHKTYNNLIIGKYGKNYFGSYVINVLHSNLDKDTIDNNTLNILYENFLNSINKLIKYEDSLDSNVFKKDTLFISLKSEINNISHNKKKFNLEEKKKTLIELLNNEQQNSYTFYKTIANYLINLEIEITDFRVIRRINKTCNESFPFPNSTFKEIYSKYEQVISSDNNDNTNNISYKSFDDSSFKYAIKKEFPVFVIDEDNKKTHHVIDIHYIKSFSFSSFINNAEEVYNKTINAFKMGDESLFPKSTDNLKFHVRPKAINSEDTFEFTNGNFITKRTFWANKNTVEKIINEKLK